MLVGPNAGHVKALLKQVNNSSDVMDVLYILLIDLKTDLFSLFTLVT